MPQIQLYWLTRNALWLVAGLVFGALPSWAQQHTVSGYVYDSDSGEALTGATVIDTKSSRGDATDQYGRFTLVVEADSVLLRFSYLGYADTLLGFFGSR